MSDIEVQSGKKVLDRSLYILDKDGKLICVGNLNLEVRYYDNQAIIHQTVEMSTVSPAVICQNTIGMKRRITEPIVEELKPIMLDLTESDTEIDEPDTWSNKYLKQYENDKEDAFDDQNAICDKHYISEWNKKINKK